MNGLVIINPSSGIKTQQRVALAAIHKLLSAQVLENVTLYYTRKKHDAYNRVMRQDANYDFVLAVGGDGTVNEVVSGMITAGLKIPLAILAAGTTNDFATSLGLPAHVGELVSLIKDFYNVPVDVGKMNDSFFLNVAAGGAIPEVAHSVTPESKTYFGKLAYYTEGVKKFSNLKLETYPLIFNIDGIEEQFDVFFFILANSRSSGGFQNIAPKAQVNDGYLDLCIIKKVDVLNALPVLNQIQLGTHVNNKRFIEYRQVKTLSVRAANPEDKPFPLDVDGEDCGVLPFSAQVFPKALNLIIPSSGKRIKKLVMN